MGRKKKNVEQQEKQVNNNVEIKDSQKYNGSVNIRLVRNGITVKNITKHNNGNTPLFIFLINCLASNYNSSGIPSFINLGHYGDGSIYNVLTKNTIQKTSSFISTNSVDNISIPQINYQFTIPTALIIPDTSGNQVDIDAMRLYNLDNINSANEDGDTNYCAEIRLNDPITLAVADLQKYTMFITWSLYITN